MDSQDRQVLDAALRWSAEGHRIALVTVAQTWGSAPRPAGAWLVIRDDGQLQGSVSGGCIEADLIERQQRGEFTSPHAMVLRYGVTQEDARRYGLPCGGTVELVVEPSPDVHMLRELSIRISNGELVRRHLLIGQSASSITPASSSDSLFWNGSTLITLHGPAWRLLIIGAGQIASYLAQMALALDYQVFICDPRNEYAAAWNVPGTELLTCMPDDAALELRLDPRSAVVALTHDPKLDDLVLLEALKSSAFYVGALGSQRNNQQRRERLRQHFDLTPHEIERLHGPVGLPIGSHTPPEIALSILAEMTAIKNGVGQKVPYSSNQAALTANCAA